MAIRPLSSVSPAPPPPRLETDDKYLRRKRTAFRDAYEQGLYHDVVEHTQFPNRSWRVPSRSEPGTVHVVIRYPAATPTPDDPWRYACTCPAGQYHHVCRHRAAVAIGLALGQGYALEYSAAGDLEAVKRLELVKEYR